MPTDSSTPPRQAQDRVVTTSYFKTMEIPTLAGRTFTDADASGAPLVIVISQSMARRDWPGASALGKRVKYQNAWRTVIGIVGDVKYLKLSDDDRAAMYETVGATTGNRTNSH